jgi:hypothetical protein
MSARPRGFTEWRMSQWLWKRWWMGVCTENLIGIDCATESPKRQRG